MVPVPAMDDAADRTDVWPIHIVLVPVIMATGGAFITTETGADNGLPQPLVMLTA